MRHLHQHNSRLQDLSREMHWWREQAGRQRFRKLRRVFRPFPVQDQLMIRKNFQCRIWCKQSTKSMIMWMIDSLHYMLKLQAWKQTWKKKENHQRGRESLGFRLSYARIRNRNLEVAIKSLGHLYLYSYLYRFWHRSFILRNIYYRIATSSYSWFRIQENG